ncbi:MULTISPECIES: ATPase domain-containing protein [Salinibaculum]|uniref:ATPase domain-containing protein n=1 Tax=Salinibaculum TaxID=2732368 RepID=UPI0030D327C5
MTSEPARLSTGIDGLDSILHGGLIEERSYMVRGPPGAGKTILGFHFLLAGVERGERVLFINLEEDLDDLKANAASLGFETDDVDFLDLSPSADVFTEDESYDVFPTAEVEQQPLTEEIVERVRAVEPERVVVDPLTQLRYLTSGEYQFRKQVVGFMRFLQDQGATVLFTTQETDAVPTDDLQFISDGAVAFDIGSDGQFVSVPKFRGSPTRSGQHTFRIDDAGMHVYPELQPSDYAAEYALEPLPTGVPEVDDLLHGGIERGTTTIISGPTGVGKTTLGTQFTSAAADRGERSVIYLFEENEDTFLARSEAVGIPVAEMVERGTLHVEEVDALEQSPQEFAESVRDEVATNGTSIVMVDGVAGYRLTLQGRESQTNKHLHALGKYLNNVGVATILVDETAEFHSDFRATSENISYLADNVVFLRHLELQGELTKAIGILKKRTSDFERTLRPYGITSDGIEVGEPLTDLRGIMTGTPEIRDQK